jgi:hypothetical protein
MTSLVTAIASLLGVAAIFASPTHVAHLVPLQWRVGNVTPLVQVARIVLGIGGVLLLARRRPVAAFLRGLATPDTALSAALALASLSFALLVAELALRVAHYPFSEDFTPPETALGRFDSDLGWSYVPGVSAHRTYGTDTRVIDTYIDSLGIRVADPSHRWDFRPSMLFIGDSFTMGHGVNAHEAFPARVEARIGGRMQAVNLGVQGYGTDQALLALERYIDRFPTRIVVYTFIPDHLQRNDNYDRRLYDPQSHWPGSKPLFGVRADGSAFLRKRPKPAAELTHLHLLQAIEFAWTRWGPLPSVELTTAIIRELARYCRSKGVRLLVVYWSFNSSTENYYMSWVKPDHLSVFAGTGADVLDLTAGAPPDWGDWVVPDDRHPNARAHDRAAKLIVERLGL